MLLNLGEKETSFETKIGMAMMPSLVAFLTVGIFMKTRQSSNAATSMSAGAAAIVTYLLTNTRKGAPVE